MLRHSKTTQNIITTLTKLKQEKKQITEKIMQSINKNNQIYEQHSLSSKKYNQGIIVNRQKSISLLQKKLNHKIKNDDQNTIKLVKVEQEAIRKRLQIEKKLEQINNRNARRIEELKLIEENVIKKIQEDLQKNQIKQKHLREQYTRIKNEQKKVHETKNYQRKESFEQWKILQAQKWRLQNLIKVHEEKQNVLITDKNPVPIKRQQKKKNEQRYIPTEKQYNKLKKIQKIDAKQAGNQYLEQAKLMHREHIMNKNKKKLMNVNLKVIGYNPDIMEKIFRNTSDLSNLNKVAKQPIPVQKEQQPQQKKQLAAPQVIEKPKVRFEFKLSQDFQTEQYLKQIKDNLNELQKVNKNEQGTNEINLFMPITHQ